MRPRNSLYAVIAIAVAAAAAVVLLFVLVAVPLLDAAAEAPGFAARAYADYWNGVSQQFQQAQQGQGK